MPTLAAVAFDGPLESTTSESLEKATHKTMPAPDSRSSGPNPTINVKLERRNGTSYVYRKAQRLQIIPALYTTPEVTPLPSSPSPYSPSPYVIDHKWREPRLPRSVSEGGVSTSLNAHEEKGRRDQEFGHNSVIASDGAGVSDSIAKLVEVRNANGFSDKEVGQSETQSGNIVWEVGNGSLNNHLVVDADSPKVDPLISKDFGDADDFYDPQDSLSRASNAEDNSVTHQFSKHTAPTGEFFDAWEGIFLLDICFIAFGRYIPPQHCCD